MYTFKINQNIYTSQPHTHTNRIVERLLSDVQVCGYENGEIPEAKMTSEDINKEQCQGVQLLGTKKYKQIKIQNIEQQGV